MTKLIGTDPNQVPSNADLGTLAYQNDDNVSLGLTTIATEGDSTRQGGGTLLRIKRTGTGTWATLAIEAQTYRGNSRIAFVDSDHPNDVGTTGTANGGGAAPFIFDYEHETEKFQMISNANTRLTIRSDGNVGIGTDDPAYKLDVEGSGNGLVVSRVRNTTAGTTARADVLVESDASDIRMIAASSLYTGVAGWADTGIIATSSGTSGGMAFNVQGSYPIRFTQSVTNERLRIHTNGNVGIGNNNPGYKLTVGGDFQSLGMYSYGGTNLGANADGRTDQTVLGGFGILAADNNRYGNYGNLAFRSSANYTGSSRGYLITNGYKANCFAIIQGTTATTIPDISGTAGGANNGTPRFVIDSGGKTCIGLDEGSSYGAQLNIKMSGGSNNAIIASINSTTSGTRRHIDFFDGSSTSRKGAIETNGTSTTYSTTSDRRLKDNIQPITDATEKLMSMNPVTHTWISSPDEPRVHGFIAQEMQEVVPEAISGDKDSEEMMSMDYGRITPVLVAALQEANKKISELEARLNDAGL
jgi:hypothetical protein